MKRATNRGEPCEDKSCRYNSSVSGCCFGLRDRYCFKEKPAEYTQAATLVATLKAFEKTMEPSPPSTPPTSPKTLPNKDPKTK